MGSTMHCNFAEQLDRLPVNDDWGVEATALLLRAAWEAGASDLHVSCRGGGVAVHLRRESERSELLRLPLARKDLLLARFKVMARLPAFVRHDPQDGRIDWTPPSAASPLALRVSFLPTIHGESLHIRFPEGTRPLLELEELGMEPSMRGHVERLISSGEGALLVTGPSGSGKTTTLYALARWIHGSCSDRTHVLTIEDPVERDLEFATQMQVDEARDLTFAKGLRAALRQDPNVLLIGEIRDLETARIAMQAGMTGHLVLSSLHAGRAAVVPSRLTAMGVDSFAVASALSGALAQRLLRSADGSGRLAVFELGLMTERARQMILGGATTEELAGELMRLTGTDLTRRTRDLVDVGVVDAREAARLFAQEEVET